MIYITGDTHRDFSRLYKLNESEDDMLIVLGDAGINYYLNEEDIRFKEYLKKFKLKIFCIRGNHEERLENINTYKDYLSIEVSNPVSVNPINEHGNLETTKENKNNHGLGIKSIQAIVKKYNGILNYEWNNGIFKLNIMLQIR